jgi:hypothetical protein
MRTRSPIVYFAVFDAVPTIGEVSVTRRKEVDPTYQPATSAPPS